MKELENYGQKMFKLKCQYVKKDTQINARLKSTGSVDRSLSICSISCWNDNNLIR